MIDITDNRTPPSPPSNDRTMALKEALARMTDPEVRAHFERLLRELGHMPDEDAHL